MNSITFRTGILIISAIFIFSACNKNKNNTLRVEGTVYDPNTKVNVVGANVTIAASKLNTGGIFSSGYEDIASVVTDANGAFSFDFKEERFSGYQITIAKDHYFGLVVQPTTSDIVAGQTFTPTYNIYPECWVNMQIRNFTPINTNDHVAYGFSAGYVNCYECCDNTTYQGNGMNYADTIVCKTYGNQNVTLTYYVTKNGNTVQHTATHYCPANDTTIFNIMY